MFEESSPSNGTIIEDGGGTGHHQSMSHQITSHQAFQLWITYGWLGEAIATILVVIIIIWATIMHYSYRNKWRTLDILMAAVLLQELPQAILVFVISLINSSFINLSLPDDHLHHLHPHDHHDHPNHQHHSWNNTMFQSNDTTSTNTTICDVLIWCNHSLRFFQFAIITSLIVDRALILKWPYQYRFTIRHSQIRFYMISLALISSLFGAFAVISHQNHLDISVVQATSPTLTTPVQDTRTLSVNSTDYESIDQSSRNNNITIDASDDNNRTLMMMIWKEESSSSYDASSIPNEFSIYNPNIYDLRFGYFVLTIYILLTLICFGSFLYVEINRPRISLGGGVGGGVLDTPNTTTTNTTISSITQSHTTNNNNNHRQQQQQNSAKTSLNHSQQRYLQSIATMFTATTATNGSSTSSSSATSNNTTATASSSTSSSLSASGSPIPSRFSSMANLTGVVASVEGVGGNGGNGESLGDHHQSSKTPSTLPSYYYPNVEQQQTPSQNQVAINDLILQDNHNHNGGGHQSSHGHHHTASSTYTSMTTTDNSIRRLIQDGGSGLNNHHPNDTNEMVNQNNASQEDVAIDHPHPQLRHLSPLDLILPNVLSHVNSFQSKSNQSNQLHHKLNHHHHPPSTPLPLYHSHNGSQLKLNTINDSSNDSSSTFSTSAAPHHHPRNNHHLYRHSPRNHHHHHHHHHSAFDLRWSSVVGPVSFCFAFNHGPYLVFTLLAILIPGIWTPFHDLILAGLSLFQALFLPLIIFISNETFRESIQQSSCCCCCWWWCWCCWCCTDEDHDHEHSHHHRHNQHNRHHHNHHHPHLHSMHKISMANNPKSSLAFSTNDGNVIMATPPPSYLHVANASAKQMSALATTISSNDGGGGYHHSDLDLLRKYSKNAFDQSPKLSKISFLKHNKDLAFNFGNNYSNDNNHHRHKPMAHATSMLDLSRNGGTTSYHHHHHHPPHHHHQQQPQHPNYYQQQQQPQQHYHASRSRHSLAAQLSNNHQQNHKHNGYNNQNENTLTPKSSFQRRPPSVASCNYLFSNQSIQSSKKGASSLAAAATAAAATASSASRCSQYLFGSNKSESTLSVPLATVISSSQSMAAAAATTTSTITTTTSASTNVIGKCSPISINLNHGFDPPTASPMATTTTIANSNNKMIDLDNTNHVNHNVDGNDDDDDDVDVDDDDIVLGHHQPNHVNIKSNNPTNKCGGPKLLELISGLAGRSASNNAGMNGSRKRSVRKCDSDASTFFHHKNLKRSQIAQNQLSNILFNNFLSKKFHSTSASSKNASSGSHIASNPNGSSFGSEIILIQENDDHHQINGSRTPPPPLTTSSSLSSMFRRFDQQDDPYYNPTNHHSNNHGNQFPRPHVYLPNISMMANDCNVSGSFLESNTRSNSCQQLSILNQAETDHYHNHLLLKQNLPTTTTTTTSTKATMAAATNTPTTMMLDMDRGKKNKKKKKMNNSGNNTGNDSNNKQTVGGKNGKNSIIATAAAAAAAAEAASILVEDEPIYASLPEVVEDEINKTSAASSGTFSARSTLPDDCQLILYGGEEDGDGDGDDTNNENQLNNNKFLKKKKNFNNNGVGNNNASLQATNNHHQASTRMVAAAAENVQGDENDDVNYTKDNHHHHHHHHQYRRYQSRTMINDEIGNSNNNNNSSSNSSSSSTVGESIEDIYEEVDHSMIILQQQRNNNNKDDDDDGANGNLSHQKRTASEDTLIQQNVDQRQRQRQRQPSRDFNRDDDDDEEEEDDDMSCGEAEDLDEDQISILSETSSSTFSSFTTCANQDFEFIVSQQLSNIAQKNQDDGQNPESHLQNRKANQPNSNLAEPSTLSMAAMYYNRLIMNKDSNHAKSGHRQRSKLNRRQSFSTAHELRQRILCSQTSMMNQNGRESSSTSDQQKMSLIEEECHPEEMVANNNGPVTANANDDYPLFTANFNDMFQFKLDRRISSSEDNLLSIISTIANCGDQETEPNTPTKVVSNNQAATNQIEESKNNDSNCSSTPKHQLSSNNGTFSMKKDSLITKSNNTNANTSTQVSAIPRATFLTPKLSSSSSSPTSSTTSSTPSSSSASTPSSKTAAKITIKELKSKKQQQQQKASANKKVLANGQTPTTTGKTSTTKLLLTGANSPNRVYELGSLWERQSSLATPTTPSKAIKAAKSPQISRARSGVPVPVSPRSNHQPPPPPSPSRVPTFISVSPLRTPNKKQLPTTSTSSNGLASKLPPPPSENVNGGNVKQKPKQDARQNAILAKNALLMSGMASKATSNK